MNIYIFRNQAKRVATVLWHEAKYTVIAYAMPNGAYYFNTIVNLAQPDEYKAVSFETLAYKATGEQQAILSETVANYLDHLKQESEYSRKWQWRYRHAIALAERRLNHLLVN